MSSLDWRRAQRFLDSSSSFSSASARMTVSPYPVKSSDFIRDLSTWSCAKSKPHLYSPLQDYSGYPQHILIHCFVWHHDSMFRDTMVGSISSSSNNSRPPRLEVLVSSIGAERSTAASSTITSWTTTSVLDSICGSTRTSTIGSGDVEVAYSTTGSVVAASMVAAPMATASGITSPSACSPVKIKSATRGRYIYSPRQVLMIAGYVPSMKVVSSSLGCVAALACCDSVASRISIERSPPSAAALDPALSHNKLVYFLHQDILGQHHIQSGK